jgi:hypothetical protein
MSTQVSMRRRNPAASGRDARKNFDPAHRAIDEGGKSIGEIAAMVHDLPLGGDSFLRDDLPDFIEFKPSPVSMWNQDLYGFRFKSAFSSACAAGIAVGILIGFMLHGSAVHASIASVFSFLG